MTEKRFFQGLMAALLLLGLAALGLHWLLIRAGEINLGRVLDRQLAAPTGQVLFLSGINQNAYHYKRELFDRVKPEVVAVGSSRAMEVRGEFFNARFLTLGGAVNNLRNLESVAAHIERAATPPALALIYVDPWLFNARYTDNQGPVPDFPEMVSADLIWGGLKSLRHGNWIAQAFRSSNLGIFSLINNEGFARDGSQYYLGTLAGTVKPYDLQFANTMARIAGDHQNFQRNAHADPALVARVCAAVATVRRAAPHVVVIAPPFAGPVWARLSEPDYAYIQEGYGMMKACLADVPFFNFANPASIHGSTDCEFVDGLHGGDVTYARMLAQVGEADPQTRRHLRTRFLEDFTSRYRGYAGGTLQVMHPGMKEVDFLGLGCRQ